MIEQAINIIEICGGVAKVAEVCQRSVSRVRRWTYEKERGGTNGIIPAECQHILMQHSQMNELGLRPEMFFPADVEQAHLETTCQPQGLEAAE